MHLKTRKCLTILMTSLLFGHAPSSAQTVKSASSWPCPKPDQLYRIGLAFPAKLQLDKEHIESVSRSTVMIEWKPTAELEQIFGASTTIYGLKPRAGHCSGILIDPTHILTAGHCLKAKNGSPKSSVSGVFRPSQMANGLQVRFGYREPFSRIRKQLTVNVVGIVETGHVPSKAKAANLDYAILEIQELQSLDLSDEIINEVLVSAQLSLTVPALGDPFTLFQHPRGSLRSFALGKTSFVGKHAVYYRTAYSDGGTSGAPLHNADGAVFAMHVSGYTKDPASGCKGATTLSSKAVTLKAIAAVSRHPTFTVARSRQ